MLLQSCKLAGRQRADRIGSVIGHENKMGRIIVAVHRCFADSCAIMPDSPDWEWVSEGGDWMAG